MVKYFTDHPFALVPVALVLWAIVIWIMFLAFVAWLHLSERGEADKETKEAEMTREFGPLR